MKNVEHRVEHRDVSISINYSQSGSRTESGFPIGVVTMWLADSLLDQYWLKQIMQMGSRSGSPAKLHDVFGCSEVARVGQ